MGRKIEFHKALRAKDPEKVFSFSANLYSMLLHQLYMVVCLGSRDFHEYVLSAAQALKFSGRANGYVLIRPHSLHCMTFNELNNYDIKENYANTSWEV